MGPARFRQLVSTRHLPPPPPPPPSQVGGGAAGVSVASVPILPTRGGIAPARGAVRPPTPPLPPPVGAMPPHAGQGGSFRLMHRQWGQCLRMRVRGCSFRLMHPPVGSKGPQADLMELHSCLSLSPCGFLLLLLVLPRGLFPSWI